MPSTRPPRRGKISPAAGLFPVLQEKSKTRRDAQRQLSLMKSVALQPRNDLLPRLIIENVAIDSVRPAQRRVRRIDAKQAARLTASIDRFGICAPILVDGNGNIIHGHGLWEAARRRGLATVPVIEITHLGPGEIRALTLALNRIGETGEWDSEALKLEFAELLDLNEDLVATGFELAEVDALLLEEDDADDDSEDLPALPSAAVSVAGDLWQLGDHLLLQGNALEASSYEKILSNDEAVRFVLTDVPYNVPNQGHVTSNPHHGEFAMAHGELSREQFADFQRTWMEHAQARLIDGGFIATFIDWRSVELILACARELGLDLTNLIVWAKSNGGQGSLWRSMHELMPVFKKGDEPHVNNVGLGRFGRWRSNLWTYPGASSLGSDARDGLALHPTVKPKKMLEDALLDVTNRRDIVLDPFLGSGSTLLAAQSTGRVCRAVEIDGRYCDVAIKRWQTATGLSACLAQTGKTFAEVALRRSAEAGGEGDK